MLTILKLEKRDPRRCSENIYEFVHPYETEYPENFYEITPDGHNPNTTRRKITLLENNTFGK